MALIELKDIGKSYGPRNVLERIDLSIEEGEFVSVVGASASGNATSRSISSKVRTPSSASPVGIPA